MKNENSKQEDPYFILLFHLSPSNNHGLQLQLLGERSIPALISLHMLQYPRNIPILHG